jgi:transcription elongation factor Elf1
VSTMIFCPFCKKKVNHVHVSLKLIKTQKWIYECEKCEVRFQLLQEGESV